MRRWLLTILLIVAALLAAIAIAAQLLFATDIPRRLVINALSESTGLRFDAAALETGWRGRTRLRDLTIALPLEQDPFVRIPRMNLTHTDLVRLAIFRKPILDIAIINQPDLWLQQNRSGQWNIIQAAHIVQQRIAAGESETAELPPLPKLNLNDATINVVDATGRHVVYGPLNLDGQPLDALSWAFELSLENQTLARGRLAPRSSWAHEIDFNLQHIHALVAPWVDTPPTTLQAAGSWAGQVQDNALRGALRLNPLRAESLTAEGEVAISVAAESITLQPTNLHLELDDQTQSLAVLRSGFITVDLATQSVAAQRILVSGPDIAAEINGTWSSDDNAAKMRMQWSGTIDDLECRHGGHLTAHLEMPSSGWHVLSVDLQSFGTLPQTQWDSHWQLSARGENWRTLKGSLHTSDFTIHHQHRDIDLYSITARFTTAWPIVQLVHLELPDTETQTHGQFDAESGAWSVHFSAQQWQIPGLQLLGFAQDSEHPLPLDVQLNASGDYHKIDLQNLTVSSAGNDQVRGFGLGVSGLYTLKDAQPLQVRAELRTQLTDDDASATLHADLAVTGMLRPLELSLAGNVHATDFLWEDCHLDDLTIPLSGSVRPDHATFESDQFSLLGGQWQLTGRYNPKTQHVRANLKGNDASLAEIVRFIDAPMDDLAGNISANVHLNLPQLNLSLLQLTGQWEALDINGYGLEDATGHGHIEYFNSLVRLANLHVKQNGGALTGWAELNLRDIHHLLADVNLDDWAMTFPEQTLQLNLQGHAHLKVDMMELAAVQGSSLALRADLDWQDQPIGQLDVQADIGGRAATIQNMQLAGLGGSASGSGTVYLTAENWHASTFELSWQDIDLSLVPLPFEDARPLVGIANGTFRIAPANDPRAPEPSRVDLNYQLADAAYGPFTFGDGSVTGYLGSQRFMIQQSTFEVADGSIDLWGRVTQHERQPFTHIYVQLQNIDLQQIADYLGYTEYPMPGRIHGSGGAGGYLTEPHRLFGQATMELTDSDIVSLPGVAQLYRAANIDFRRPQPRGRGEVLLRLENEGLNIARLTYFNRGMDIIARARVDNLWLGSESPISGLAAGTAAPLRDSWVPFVGEELDRLLSALQSDAITVRISGTVAEHETSLVPLAEVTNALRRILSGRVD